MAPAPCPSYFEWREHAPLAFTASSRAPAAAKRARVGTCFAAFCAVTGAFASDLDWQPVDSATLDDLRGGFEIASGLKASFGVERAAYVNGELVAQHSVSIPDIASMTPEQAHALDQAISAVVLIQNGPNNSFDVAQAPAGATVIQNTLNDQHIVTVTTIHADVGSLSLLHDAIAQESLQLALNKAVGVR